MKYTYSHIFNKSISGYQIFKNPINCQRFYNLLGYYNNKQIQTSYSHYIIQNPQYKITSLYSQNNNQSYVIFISYCLMPDHYHLLVKSPTTTNLSKYLSDVENSYTRFFNCRYKRIGPLWQTSYKSVKINNNEQLLHVSRYIHLNPVTSYLTNKAETWKYSSYRELINSDLLSNTVIDISIKNKEKYKQFIEDNIDYQRKLKKIRRFLIDAPSRKTT